MKYSFTHGGKDGFPFPVDREVYDNSIRTLRDPLESAKLEKREKHEATKRLSALLNA